MKKMLTFNEFDDMSGDSTMDEYSDDEGSGLELVNVADFMDDLGNWGFHFFFKNVGQWQHYFEQFIIFSCRIISTPNAVLSAG